MSSPSDESYLDGCDNEDGVPARECEEATDPPSPIVQIEVVVVLVVGVMIQEAGEEAEGDDEKQLGGVGKRR